MSDARKYLKDVKAHSDKGMDQHLMAAALLAVLDLHRKSLPYCLADDEDWPCSTVRAIDKALGVTDE